MGDSQVVVGEQTSHIGSDPSADTLIHFDQTERR